MSGSILYALACVLVPVAWGLLTVWIVGIVEKRLGMASQQESETPIAQDDRV